MSEPKPSYKTETAEDVRAKRIRQEIEGFAWRMQMLGVTVEVTQLYPGTDCALVLSWVRPVWVEQGG